MSNATIALPADCLSMHPAEREYILDMGSLDPFENYEMERETPPSRAEQEYVAYMLERGLDPETGAKLAA